ncbi:MAG: transcription termination factor Rho [Myxococcota bacterium]|nr:transcription termination factor Rho [Myxococcota bacterium]
MSFDLSELRPRRIADLVDIARELGVDNAPGLKKQELVFEIVRRRAARGGARGAGVLETLPDGFGFLRSPDCNYLPGPDDIYVSPSQIRRFNLRTGDLVAGQVRAPKEGERYFALIKIEAVNERSPDSEREKILFDNLTPVFPNRPLPMGDGEPAVRFVDLAAPIGFGHRVLLKAPPRSGRTFMITAMVQALRAQTPDVAVMIVLIDGRPEEVTVMDRAVDAEVLTSTFDEPPSRHVQVADMALERARRMAEQGRDVVVFLDSLTRLARAYNAVSATGTREVHGAVDMHAIHLARRTFGAGRALEEGGSLTMIATALTGTASPVDKVLLDEQEGSANVELFYDGGLAAARIRPAIDPIASHSRDAEHLHPSAERAAREALLNGLSLDPRERHAALLQRIEGAPDNATLLGLRGLDRKAAAGE